MSEQQKTVRLDDVVWLPPVDRVEDLPAGAATDCVCYVKADNAIYRSVMGVWVCEVAKGTPKGGP